MAASVFDFLFSADGRRLRYGVFEPGAAATRAVVFLNGQSEFIEKYRETIGELNARGFRVMAFDWRGQGGSQRGLDNPMKCHVESFAEFDADLAAFMDQVVAPRVSEPPVLLAHSMGSHLAIRALHDRPGLFRAAVLVAPMLAISTRGYPGWLVRAMAVIGAGMGKSRDFAWGMEKREPLTATFETQLCTSDPARFERTQKFLRAHPELRLGGPTWGWIEAAYRSMHAMEAPGYAEAIKTPVLIAGAGKDRIVVTDATRRFAARLPNGRYVEFEDSEHEILQENDTIRARFWSEFDRFTAAQ